MEGEVVNAQVVDVASVKPETSEAQSRIQINITGGHKCPICGQVYADVAQHLRVTENVTNRTELALLAKLAHRRFTTNLDCPVRFCKAKYINRLDKHLQKVHELKKPMITTYMQKAKDRYIAMELALLRASNPTPPMVSHLDEVDEAAVEEGIKREMEARSQAASPAASFASCLTAVCSSPPASKTSIENTTPNMFPPSNSFSEAHSEHAILNMPSPSHSAIETPCAHSTPNKPPPSHTANKYANEHAFSDMHSYFVSKMAAPDKSAMPKRKRPLLREPSPDCRNCQVLFAELKVVKRLLQCEIERNDEPKQLHSSTNCSNAVKYKRRKVSFSPSTAPHYVKLVEEFRGHVEGVNPNRKAKENANQRATHIIHFLEFMADSATPNVDLLFLTNYSRVRDFVAHLQDREFKPTTQRMYLMDVVAFLKYILNMSPASVKLGTKWINALLVELRARLRDIGRDVVGYQLKVRQSKSDRLVDARRHKLFIEVAPENIAAALDDLEKQPENRAMLKLFFGFLSGYIIAITGHRKGVVINMTTERVETAEKAKDGARIIRVEHHKTQRYFGQAAIPLKANEYAWFERYNQLREYVKGGSEASTFFHNSTGGVLLKLDQYFKEAWEGIDLGIAPTFSMLRYSLATYAKRQLGHKTYRKVATFMCHDKHTAKKFYQADDPAEEVLRSRYLSVLAISTYAAKKRSKECKKAYGHNDNMETVSSSEEEVELESSGPEKPKVSLSAEDGAGDRKTTVNVTQPDSEEEMEQVPRKTYQLHKRNKIVRSKQQRPINLSKHMVSSSEDDGTDDWEPTQDSSADDSEMEEGPILQRQKCMVTSREADGKPTQGYSENGSEWEEKQERQMVKKEAKKKLVASPVLQKEDKKTLMRSSPCLQLNTAISPVNCITLKTPENQRLAVPPGQAYISPGKASILKIHSSKTVFDGTSKVKRQIFHQSSLFEITLPISGNNKRHQVGSPPVQIVISGHMGEAGQGREAEI